MVRQLMSAVVDAVTTNVKNTTSKQTDDTLGFHAVDFKLISIPIDIDIDIKCFFGAHHHTLYTPRNCDQIVQSLIKSHGSLENLNLIEKFD